MKQNLFLEITRFVHKEQLNVNVEQGYTENTVWITGDENGLICQSVIVKFLKYTVRHRIHLYFDCDESVLKLYKPTRKAEE